MESLNELRYKVKHGSEDANNEIEKRMSSVKEIKLTGINSEKVLLTGYDSLCRKCNWVDTFYKSVNVKSAGIASILLDSYSSATIEGAVTTVEQVKRCFSSPKTKDDKMVVNTVKGCIYAYSNKITESNIRELWEIITDEVCENRSIAGNKYRTGRVYIGNGVKVAHEPASVEQIDNKMHEMFEYAENRDEVPNLIIAAILHFYFVYIHPFCDGNGRTARILNSSYLYNNGYKKFKSIALSNVINESRMTYYKKLNESDKIQEYKGHKFIDASPFVDYMIDVYEQGIKNLERTKNSLSDSETKILEKMNKVGKGATITVNKACKILKLSDSSVRKVLNNLVSMKYLEVDKSNRPYRYIYK